LYYRPQPGQGLYHRNGDGGGGGGGGGQSHEKTAFT